LDLAQKSFQIFSSYLNGIAIETSNSRISVHMIPFYYLNFLRAAMTIAIERKGV